MLVEPRPVHRTSHVTQTYSGRNDHEARSSPPRAGWLHLFADSYRRHDGHIRQLNLIPSNRKHWATFGAAPRQLTGGGGNPITAGAQPRSILRDNGWRVTGDTRLLNEVFRGCPTLSNVALRVACEAKPKPDTGGFVASLDALLGAQVLAPIKKRR